MAFCPKIPLLYCSLIGGQDAGKGAVISLKNRFVTSVEHRFLMNDQRHIFQGTFYKAAESPLT